MRRLRRARLGWWRFSAIWVLSNETCGDLDLACVYFERALEVREAVAPRSVETAKTLKAIGLVHNVGGNANLARGFLDRAFQLEAAFNSGPRDESDGR